MATQSSFIEVEDTRLYVEDGGAGKPVLLLHGLALDQRSWDEQVAPLREHHRVVRIDLHGFGRSSAVRGPYSHVTILCQLILRLGMERPHVVGHSMGGRIAAELVQMAPEVARSLTLICPDITGLPFKTLGPGFARIFEAGGLGDLDTAKRLFLELPMFDSLRRRPELLARVRAQVDDYSGWFFANVRENRELRPPRPTAEALSAFGLPTLVVAGALETPDFHDIADEVVRRVPRARKCLIGEAGHMPHLEAPEPFNAALLEFLSQVTGTPPR